MIVTVIQAIILGVIEGITEFLPVSSTGHLYLANAFIHLHEPVAFINLFMVVIQLGAIMAVVVLYFHKLNPIAPSKTTAERHATWVLWVKVVVAMLPSLVVGPFVDDFMDAHLTTWPVITTTLIVYGVLFIVVERINANRSPKTTALNRLSLPLAFTIGLCQLLSLVPGTSRSGATILGAMVLGTSRFVATEFSFFLAIPTMVGASALKVLKFTLHGNHMTGPESLVLAVGVIVSFVVAYAAIKFLMRFIQYHDFKIFGWYRIALALIIFGYFGLQQLIR